VSKEQQKGKLILGPKFKYKKSTSIQLSSTSSRHNAALRECKYRLPLITRRQLHNKAIKLAFILPNYKASKRIGPHNEDVISLLAGSLLGDCLAEREKSGGVRFRFKQSEAHKDYIFWLYEFFNKRGYCTNNLPVFFKDGNKLQHTCYRFSTYSYTNLMWLYKLFYNHNKQKRVPKNIADLLTPLSLAVWICEVGDFHRSSVRLHTNSFTQEEVMLLSLALETKFNIKSTLHKNKYNFQLYIKLESMPLLKELVIPCIIPSMRYKLGL
jgi:hypothetical protein